MNLDRQQLRLARIVTLGGMSAESGMPTQEMCEASHETSEAGIREFLRLQSLTRRNGI